MQVLFNVDKSSMYLTYMTASDTILLWGVAHEKKADTVIAWSYAVVGSGYLYSNITERMILHRKLWLPMTTDEKRIYMKRASFLLAALMIFTGCTENTAPAEIREDYSSAMVSYLGPEGTYTQEACVVFFGRQETIPCGTVEEAVVSLENSESDYAVIPQENTIGGAVVDYVDTVIAHTGVSVAGEVELPINQDLLVLPGTKLGDIKTVYSHKQGIAQGKVWIEENIPDAEIIEVSSTAEGARIVSEGKDSTCAAIASAACVDVYGLEILAEAIQNNDRNKTRFYVLTLDEPRTTGSRTAFIAAGKAEDLPVLMAAIKDSKASLVTVHDRPRKTELGEYYYLIECSDCGYEQYKKITEKADFEYRFLGCFDTK